MNGKDSPFFTYTVDANHKVEFNNKSKFASSYFWDFGDGAYSFDSLPVHTYNTEGSYTVTLYTYNDNCPSDDIYSTEIEIASPTVASFTFNQTDFCKPSSIQFFDASSNNTKNRFWEFQGGIPASSSDLNPVVIYYETGSFNVKLTASNSLYTNSLELKNVVQISTTPVVNFVYTINSNKVSFTNNTQNGNSYEWDFGDGTFSNESNPVHIYANKGVYIVKLIATNDCGKEISEKTLVVNMVKTSDLVLQKFNFFPNPNNGEFSLELEIPEGGYYDFKVYNSTGILVLSDKKEMATGFNTLDFLLRDVPGGLYLFRISKDGKSYSTIFSKK
ncbi:MAG: PKD domain-containing protein [Saprospiraceae bacterium]|nr:PKD domain-containing protein [Saprospiraceae bacterium]